LSLLSLSVLCRFSLGSLSGLSLFSIYFLSIFSVCSLFFLTLISLRSLPVCATVLCLSYISHVHGLCRCSPPFSHLPHPGVFLFSHLPLSSSVCALCVCSLPHSLSTLCFFPYSLSVLSQLSPRSLSVVSVCCPFVLSMCSIDVLCL